MTIRIRNSSITKFMRCRRTWMLSYVRNLETNWDLRMTPQKFDTGTSVHRGLEALYLGESPEAAVRAYWAELQEVLSPEADHAKWIEEVVTLPLIIIEGYQEWREEEGADVGDTILGLEVKLDAIVGTWKGEDVELYGTIDRLIRNSDGHLIVDDFKTVVTIDTVPTLATNWQINNYGLLVRANYDEMPLQGRHTQLKRVKRTARAKKPFYNQIHTTFNEAKMHTHWVHLNAVVMDMLSVMERLGDGANHGLAYPNPTRDCSWDCSFKDVCPMMDNGGDWQFMLEDGFRQREEV